MALSKKPVNGMKDILPAEMEIRDYVTSVIKDTYRSFGFTPIETPCMENIANLSNKQGGENEKLIFKILKRGEMSSTTFYLFYFLLSPKTTLPFISLALGYRHPIYKKMQI